MAIAPIDLQTMYAQMGHLAKIASDQQNGPHLAQQLQEQRRIQQDAEKAKLVKKTADQESKAMIVGKDGRRGGRKEPFEQNDESKKEKEDEEESCQEIRFEEIRDSNLGNHISIES